MERRTFLRSGAAVGAISLAPNVAGITGRVRRGRARSPENPLRLNANENPLGLSPAARQAVISGIPDANRYPFASEERVVEALAAKMGFAPEQMLTLCRRAQAADLKLSVTAILGLAGVERSHEHALATAAWVSELSPEYFSLLTLFHRHNDDFLRSITPLSNGAIIAEALEIVRHLTPQKTILRSNHVSNILNLAGSYPKDREQIIAQAEYALALARRDPRWFAAVPDYSEELY